MITDITYCDAVRCAVTASRDTTIKVWDEKWNIKTVFVGHTGEWRGREGAKGQPFDSPSSSGFLQPQRAKTALEGGPSLSIPS